MEEGRILSEEKVRAKTNKKIIKQKKTHKKNISRGKYP